MNKRNLPFIIMIFVGMCIIVLISVASAISAIQESKVTKATLPYSCDDVKGMQLGNLRYELQEMGFNNISTNEITTDEGRINIWNGYIKEVTVNGKVDFDSTQKYKLDTPIIISYYNVKTVNGQAESLMHPDTDGYRPISMNDFNGSTESYIGNFKVALSGKFEINKCMWCYNNVLLGSLEDEVFIDGKDCGTVQDFIEEHDSDEMLVHGYEIRMFSDNEEYNVYSTFFCNEYLPDNLTEITVFGKFNDAWIFLDKVEDVSKIRYTDDNGGTVNINVIDYEYHYSSNDYETNKNVESDGKELDDIIGENESLHVESMPQDKKERIESISIHKDGNTTYATANDIVYLYSNSDSVSKYDYDIEGDVCITGKIKKYSQQDGMTSIPIYGEYENYNIASTEDYLTIDNDEMTSSIGIEIDVETGLDENSFSDAAMSVAQAEEYGSTDNKFYVTTKFGKWVQTQKDTGNWYDGAYIRVYGTGKNGLFIYKVDNCKRVELLNNNMEVVSTWVSDK